MSPHLLSGSRHETEGHELALVRCVALDDADVRDPRQNEPSTDGLERSLVRCGEDDGVRPLGQVAGRRFARSVDELRGEEAYREIPSDNHIVGDGSGLRSVGGERYVNRFSVATSCAWG